MKRDGGQLTSLSTNLDVYFLVLVALHSMLCVVFS
jgi:hypothetical protein